MHLLVTDRLACPHCGPSFGLLLLAHKMENRRVMDGHFGCPNCRASYPVRGGYADFRVASEPRSAAASSSFPEGDAEAGLRLAAMIGVREGPGMLLLMGGTAAQAPRLAAMIPDIEVVALHPDIEEWGEAEGVSRGRTGSGLPFFAHTMRGVALDTTTRPADELAECVRVLAPGARLVIEQGGERVLEGYREAMERAGLEVLLATERLLVGQK